MQRRTRLTVDTRTVVIATMALAASAFAVPSAAEPGDNSIVSLEAASQRAAGQSKAGVSVSETGRYVAFDSESALLVTGDTNARDDVFVIDRATGITERVSTGFGGAEPNGSSGSPTLTPDGRYVAFESWADNLVPGDTNGVQDVYLYDRQSHDTRRVSIKPNETQFAEPCECGGISDDARYIAFACRYFGVYLRDTTTGITTLIAQEPALESYASINGNGRYILYKFDFEDPVHAYDRLAGSSQVMPGIWGVFSPDGRWFAYESDESEVPADVNDLRDIYLLDRSTGRKRLVSVRADGRQSTTMNYTVSAVSSDGRYVVFDSSADGLVQGVRKDADQLVIKDMLTGALEYVTSSWYGARLSRDGRFLAFDTEVALVSSDRNGSGYYSFDGVDTYVHEVGRSSDVPPVYIFQLRPSRVDFGEVRVASSNSKGFMLTNSGSNGPLPITLVELTGPDRLQFAVKNYCKSPLDLGYRCWVAVTFRPSGIGYKQAQLHVVAGGVDRYRTLTGTGVR